MAPYGLNILIAGPSGSGKSTIAAAVIERLMERTYQLCIVDPEGDYGTLPEVFTIGSQHHAVTVTEVLAFLEDTKVNHQCEPAWHPARGSAVVLRAALAEPASDADTDRPPALDRP